MFIFSSLTEHTLIPLPSLSQLRGVFFHCGPAELWPPLALLVPPPQHFPHPIFTILESSMIVFFFKNEHLYLCFPTHLPRPHSRPESSIGPWRMFLGGKWSRSIKKEKSRIFFSFPAGYSFRRSRMEWQKEAGIYRQEKSQVVSSLIFLYLC